MTPAGFLVQLPNGLSAACLPIAALAVGVIGVLMLRTKTLMRCSTSIRGPRGNDQTRERRGAITRLAVLAISASLLHVSDASAQAMAATLYFIPWDVETRSSLTADRVRQYRQVQVVMFDSQQQASLLRLLREDRDPSIPPERINDLRFVADFTTPDGRVVTFVGNRFGVLEVGTGAVRSVDADFRKRLAATLLP